jgi:hypothetical protein
MTKQGMIVYRRSRQSFFTVAVLSIFIVSKILYQFENSKRMPEPDTIIDPTSYFSKNHTKWWPEYAVKQGRKKKNCQQFLPSNST